MTTERKILIGGGLATILIIAGGLLLTSKQDEHLKKPLLGKEVKVSGGHVPEGTQVPYSTNPPVGGQHYDKTAPAGIYDKMLADGNLVHSLEHGAVILWYNPKLVSKAQIKTLKEIFNQTSGKGIIAPRESMDAPVVLSSWGRILKLKTIDEKQIKAFFDSNSDRAPEQAPI